MARGATTSSSSSRADQDANVNNSNPEGDDKKTSKRRCVQSACVPCRKRKSKCDGRTPFCATCTAVYQTECYYDERDTRRNRQVAASSSSSSAAGIKRDAPDGATSNADYLLNTIRQLPEDQVYDFIRQLRRDSSEDLNDLAESWRQNVELPSSTPVDVNSLEHELSLLLGKPAVTFAGESRHLGHSASLGLVPEEENFANARARSTDTTSQRQGTTWTTVTSDLAFVGDLLTLYFNWSHPFYVLLSRECFYKDFRSGRDKYCSSLLVNAICAYACHLTDDPKARTDPSNFRTAGDHFFAEARQLLFEDESPSLTTVQALCIMAMREASTARDSPGFSYMGRCIRMCVELGLHLNNSASPELGLTPSEIEVRKVTFWGAFTVDSAYSICVGRIAQLPRAAITLDKPILDETTEQTLSSPLPPMGTVPSRVFLQEFSTLSELINDNNYLFFAPKERLNSTKLLDQYSKYQAWYLKLPSALVVDSKKVSETHFRAEPHILVLHMLYYTIIIHLFRPMLKLELLHSEVRPRDVCVDAANTISDLVRIYRLQYSFRQAHLIIPHILLTICTVHLMYSKTSTMARQNLIEGLKGLEDLHECHNFGARSFRLIYELAKQWQFPWPEELQASKLIPEQEMYKSPGTRGPTLDPLLVAPSSAAVSRTRTPQNLTYLPVGSHERRESLSMFADGYPQSKTEIVTPPSRVLSNQSQHSPVRGQSQSSFHSLPLQTYNYAQSLSMPTDIPAAGTSSNHETFFFTPIPGMPGPTLPRSNYMQSSPLGVDNTLRSTNTGDGLVRDGFKLDGNWHNSQTPQYAGHGATNNQYTGFPTVPSADFTSRDGVNYQQADENIQYQSQNEVRGAHGDQGGYDPSWWPDVKFNPNQ